MVTRKTMLSSLRIVNDQSANVVPVIGATLPWSSACHDAARTASLIDFTPP